MFCKHSNVYNGKTLTSNLFVNNPIQNHNLKSPHSQMLTI